MRENQDGTIGSYETDIVVPDLKKDAGEGQLGRRRHAAAGGRARSNDRNPLVARRPRARPERHARRVGRASISTSTTRSTIRRDGRGRRVMTSLAFFRGKVRAFETPPVETHRARRPDKKTAVVPVRRARLARSRPVSTPARSTSSTTSPGASRSRDCSCTCGPERGRVAAAAAFVLNSRAAPEIVPSVM